MGLFSIDKSSRTETKVTNEYADNRSVNDAGGGIIGGFNRVENTTQITDGESVKNALAFATKAQAGAAGFNLSALDRTFDLAGMAAANSQKRAASCSASHAKPWAAQRLPLPTPTRPPPTPAAATVR